MPGGTHAAFRSIGGPPLKRPYSQPLRLGGKLILYVGGYACLYVMTRYKGLRAYAAGPSVGRGLGGHTACRWARENEVKRPLPAKLDLGQVMPYAEMGKGLEKFEKLKQFLTQRYYEDGTPRKPGWIGLSVEEGCFKALLKEPTAGLLMRIEIPKLEVLWTIIEAVLLQDVPPWTEDPRAEMPKKKKG